MAAAFKSIGLEARPTLDSDAETLDLGSRFTNGDECLPERITLGDFLKVTRLPGFDPQKTAFFMPTAGGPCRFGQYEGLLRKVMRDLSLGEMLVFSPSSANAYRDSGGRDFLRTAWRAVVASDALQKLLHRTRPYELRRGDADAVYEECLDRMCQVLGLKTDHKNRLQRMVAVMGYACQRFRSIPAERDQQRLLIGIVGEIYCRHNPFSNEDLTRKVEEHGGEVWLADVSEWVWYTIQRQRRNLQMAHKRFSKAMLGNRIRLAVQRVDEHALLNPVCDYLRGLEEPRDVRVLLEYCQPYLPFDGVLGEMILSVGKAIYLHEKGADGVIDTSPFTCMNGIICEAIYPRVSREHGGIPIRNFYFDGTPVDLDCDVGIFMELAHNYQRRKGKPSRRVG